jgi:transposase
VSELRPVLCEFAGEPVVVAGRTWRPCAKKSGILVTRSRDCAGCRLYVAAEAAPQPAPAPAVIQLGASDEPCEYREPLTVAERDALGLLGSSKLWVRCGHPERVELGMLEVNCPCQSCNSKCRGYGSAAQPD